MDDNLSFGRWVKVRRIALQLTQTILAERTACSTVTIRKIESDDLPPSRQIAERLAEALALGPQERSEFFRRAHNHQPSSQHTSHPPISPQTLSLPPFLAQQPAFVPPALFVGRARELADLAAALESAANGRGQILFVIGDAGRGKTVLVQEFARRAQQTEPALLAVTGHCNAHTGMGDPYLPFRDIMTTLACDVEAKWASGLLSTQSARRLWDAMAVNAPALVEHAPDLVGRFMPAKSLQRYAAFVPPDASWVQQLAKLTGNEQRTQLEENRLFTQVTAALKAIAVRHSLLLILEDLHWIDAPSGNLLFHLSREIADSPILLIGTYRPDELVGQREERHPLLNITTELKRQHGDIWLDLSELSAIEGRHFLDAYLDTQPNRLGESFRSAFFRHTGGHALFTVELLREMQERGDLGKDSDGYWVEGSAIHWQTLPAKVEAVIEKRIERLEDGLKAILAIASIEGEVFTAEVVARVQQWPEREMVQRLSNELDRQHRLVTADALNRVGGQRISRYRFRHFLFQHYLYHRLDATERAYLHEAVGSALENLYGEQTEQVAVQLAYHYEQAGVAEKAVKYLLQAGERAQRLSANREAVRHLTQGLALLADFPDSLQRTRQELALQIALSNAWTAIKGFAAPETLKVLNRAHDLALQIEEVPQIFAALHGLHAYYCSRAELHKARAVAEQMLQLAQNQPDPILRVFAHRALGNTMWNMGEFAPAREQLEQGAGLYHPQDHLTYIRLYGQDQGVACLTNLAWVLWILGYREQALQRSRQALTLARELAHSFSLAIAINFDTLIHLHGQELQIAKGQADSLVKLATEQDFVVWLANGIFFRGLVLVRLGEKEGIEQMQRGMNARLAAGEEIHKAYILTGLAEGYGTAGKSEQGINLLDEGLAMAERTDNRVWQAESYRLKGELLLMHEGDKDPTPSARFVEVEGCFLQAIEIARRQQAKALELRATTSLCRLWKSQGKRTEAHILLAKIYEWFSEGFDTTDLLEAKALLEALK